MAEFLCHGYVSLLSLILTGSMFMVVIGQYVLAFHWVVAESGCLVCDRNIVCFCHQHRVLLDLLIDSRIKAVVQVGFVASPWRCLDRSIYSQFKVVLFLLHDFSSHLLPLLTRLACGWRSWLWCSLLDWFWVPRLRDLRYTWHPALTLATTILEQLGCTCFLVDTLAWLRACGSIFALLTLDRCRFHTALWCISSSLQVFLNLLVAAISTTEPQWRLFIRHTFVLLANDRVSWIERRITLLINYETLSRYRGSLILWYRCWQAYHDFLSAYGRGTLLVDVIAGSNCRDLLRNIYHISLVLFKCFSQRLLYSRSYRPYMWDERLVLAIIDWWDIFEAGLIASLLSLLIRLYCLGFRPHRFFGLILHASLLGYSDTSCPIWSRPRLLGWNNHVGYFCLCLSSSLDHSICHTAQNPSLWWLIR